MIHFHCLPYYSVNFVAKKSSQKRSENFNQITWVKQKTQNFTSYAKLIIACRKSYICTRVMTQIATTDIDTFCFQVRLFIVTVSFYTKSMTVNNWHFPHISNRFPDRFQVSDFTASNTSSDNDNWSYFLPILLRQVCCGLFHPL